MWPNRELLDLLGIELPILALGGISAVAVWRSGAGGIAAVIAAWPKGRDCPETDLTPYAICPTPP